MNSSPTGHRLTNHEINQAQENLRSMRDQVRGYLAEQSGRDPEEMKQAVESAPIQHPLE
ncbi:MAG: hypothetical protein ABEJ65_06345 [bacterium]